MSHLWFDEWSTLVRVLLIGTLAYFGLIAFLRVSGKRTLAKMNAFDLVVTVSLGSTLATTILSRDVTLAQGAAALGLLIGLQFLITWSSVRSKWLRRVVTGDPAVLLYRGTYRPDAMRRSRVNEDEIRAAVRSQGCSTLEEVEAVVLETDGSFSVVRGGTGRGSSSLQDIELPNGHAEDRLRHAPPEADLPVAKVRATGRWLELARRTVVGTFEDGCPGRAAQLAFFFLLAVFPALLFSVALLANLPTEASLASALARLDGVLPRQVMALLQRELDQLTAGATGGLLTFGVAGAIWSSSSAMAAIITAMNRIYDVEEGRPWWKRRLLAIALTGALAAFVVTAFVLVVVGSDLAHWVAGHFGLGGAFQTTWTIARWPVALLLVVFAINLVYYFAPHADSAWVWISPGSALATALWLLFSFAFKVYLQSFGSYSAVYGAIAGAIVLMLWLYLSGFALLVGAELNAEIGRACSLRVNRPGRTARRQLA